MDQLPDAVAGTPGGPDGLTAPEARGTAGLTAPTSAEFAALSQKMDVLSVQVGYLIEQAQETARRQRERSELLHDALPIANDALELVTDQLAEIQEYVDLSDLLRLFKRLLRNGRNLDRALDQLEGLMDLAQTAGPLANSVFEKVGGQLEVAEQRGYFALAKGGARAVDRIAGSLTPEDVDCLANNAGVLLTAFKGLCRPVESPSTLGLVRLMRDPDTRRGLAIAMRMLQALGAEAAAQQQAAAGEQAAAAENGAGR